MKLLNDCVIKTTMPQFQDKSERKDSTAEANDSRLVTQVIWVVESANDI